jgi:Smg protein
MGPHEQGRFAPDAWGRLLQLKGSGALRAPELEQIIERALTHIDGRIALDDLRLLLEGSGLIDDTDGPGPDRVH